MRIFYFICFDTTEHFFYIELPKWSQFKYVLNEISQTNRKIQIIYISLHSTEKVNRSCARCRTARYPYRIWCMHCYYPWLQYTYANCLIHCGHIAIEVWFNIGSGNGLLPDGTKPFPKPFSLVKFCDIDMRINNWWGFNVLRHSQI